MNSETVEKPLSTEEKINELEARIAALEKIEKDRRRRKIIAICVKVVFYLIMIIAMVILALKLKTYYDQLTKLNGLTNFNLNGSSFEGLDINNYLQGLFNY